MLYILSVTGCGHPHSLVNGSFFFSYNHTTSTVVATFSCDHGFVLAPPHDGQTEVDSLCTNEDTWSLGELDPCIGMKQKLQNGKSLIQQNH